MSDKNDDIFRWLDEMESALRGYEEYMELQEKFIQDLLVRMAAITYDHFAGDGHHPNLLITFGFQEDEIIEYFAADEDFKYYGIWIFEELTDCVNDFEGYKAPPDKIIRCGKVEFHRYTEESMDEHLREFVENYNLSKKQVKELRETYLEDVIIDEFYVNFQVLIHNTLKKMALEHFPEIMDVSAEGLREIDYMLYSYMLMMRENIMKVVDKGSFGISIKNTVEDLKA